MWPVEPVVPGYEIGTRIYAKDQPEYIPLPVHATPGGSVTSRWRMTWRERLFVLFHGYFYLTMLTFNKPLQPVRPFARKPTIVTRRWETINESGETEVGLYETIDDIEDHG